LAERGNDVTGLIYLAAISAVTLGLTAALWIAALLALGCAAVFALAWMTR